MASLIPCEILSVVFSHLACIDRFRAALVCRHWRSSALTFAVLWTYARLSEFRCPGYKANVLLAFIQRSLDLPFDVECDQVDERLQLEIAHCIAANINRIRSIDWQASCGVDLWIRDAPLLHTLRLSADTRVFLPADLLGGKSGALRVLHTTGWDHTASLRALITVSTLSLHVLEAADLLDDLFSCFPNLETLILKWLPQTPVVSHPRVPPSLRNLFLQTLYESNDVFSYIPMWSTRATTYIHVAAPVAALRLLSSHALEGALKLQMCDPSIRGRGEGFIIKAWLPFNCRLSVTVLGTLDTRTCCDMFNDGLLDNGSSSLSSLQSTTMPLYLLHLLMRSGRQLPALRTLKLLTAVGRNEWHCLWVLRILFMFSPVSQIVLDVARVPGVREHVPADARLLVNYIHSYGNWPGMSSVSYILRGFSAVCADSVTSQPDWAKGADIRFDV
ncbi:hypothetical protein AURDEDRAFT_157892 [Auricularia subglabra TFB-10046 SS5]|nr:hypothetical protein AURDEDRAFT_157892 [Auricularia subglabra TFB-10046 SS5]